jgi:hypothetical protein
MLNGGRCTVAYGVAARRQDGGDFVNRRWKMTPRRAALGQNGNALQKIPFEFAQGLEFKNQGIRYFLTEFALD